jgi:hypothetical protein
VTQANDIGQSAGVAKQSRFSKIFVILEGSIVSDYGLDDRGSIPGRGKGFFL